MIFITFLYFIFGIIFINSLMPLMDEIITLILTKIAYHKAKIQVEIAKMNKEIQKIAESDEEEYHPPQIGFVITDDMEEELEDDDI